MFEVPTDQLKYFEKVSAIQAGYFLLRELNRREPSRWLGGPLSPKIPHEGNSPNLFSRIPWYKFNLNPRVSERAGRILNWSDLLCAHQLIHVRRSSILGLKFWLENPGKAILLKRIPSPTEMLDIQTEGIRFVSLLGDENVPESQLGRHADTFAFFLHDLEHLYKFNTDAESHRGQRNFFLELRLWLHNGALDFALTQAGFLPRLEYLMSDMNSHPMHLFKYLKAILQDLSGFDLQSTFRRLIESWPQDVRESAERINIPGLETAHDRLVVTEHFIRDGVWPS